MKKIKTIEAVVAYRTLKALKQKTEKYFSDLANAEVEVAIEDVDEKELFKAAKDCGLKFADMESLEVVIG